MIESINAELQIDILETIDDVKLTVLTMVYSLCAWSASYILHFNSRFSFITVEEYKDIFATSYLQTNCVPAGTQF